MSTWTGITRSFKSSFEAKKHWTEGHYLTGSPPQRELEEQLQKKYSSPSLVTNCGITAITIAIHALTRPGDTVACSRAIYPGTRALFEELKAEKRLKLSWFNPEEFDCLRTKMREGRIKLVFLETIGNAVYMPVASINTLAIMAECYHCKVVVDSTLTPEWMPPGGKYSETILLVGSMTKYEQPNDIWMGGRISGCESDIIRIKSSCAYQRAAMLPQAASYYLKNLAGTEARYRTHSAAALDVANICQEHSAVQVVHYPGLKSHPDYYHIKNDYGGLAGGLLYLEFTDPERADKRFCNCLTEGGLNWEIAPSFGSKNWRVVPFTDEPLRNFVDRDGVMRIATGRIHREQNLEALQKALELLVNY